MSSTFGVRITNYGFLTIYGEQNMPLLLATKTGFTYLYLNFRVTDDKSGYPIQSSNGVSERDDCGATSLILKYSMVQKLGYREHQADDAIHLQRKDDTRDNY